MGFEESPVTCLSLLPTRGVMGGGGGRGAPALVVSVPPKTLAFWNVILFKFISPTFVGFFSNLFSVEHHLAGSSPNILLLSETQLSHDILVNSFNNISNNNLHSWFRFKGGVCVYPTSTHLLYTLWTSDLQTFMSSGLRFISWPSLSFSVSLTAFPILQTL